MALERGLRRTSEAGSRLQKRGRPSKFGRPSRLVALTLPEDVIRGLRTFHPDLAWAIVALFEKRPTMAHGNPRAEAELVNIGERQSLIVIDRATYKGLSGVDIVPLAADRAFLALEPGAGMDDLDNAIRDQMESATVRAAEHRALARLRTRLRAWRRDRALRFHTRTIIVVERVRPASALDGSARTGSAKRKTRIKKPHR